VGVEREKIRPEKIKGYSMNVELELLSEGNFLVPRPTMNVDVNVSGETLKKQIQTILKKESILNPIVSVKCIYSADNHGADYDYKEDLTTKNRIDLDLSEFYEDQYRSPDLKLVFRVTLLPVAQGGRRRRSRRSRKSRSRKSRR
jgi:hypothetical protein